MTKEELKAEIESRGVDTRNKHLTEAVMRKFLRDYDMELRGDKGPSTRDAARKGEGKIKESYETWDTKELDAELEKRGFVPKDASEMFARGRAGDKSKRKWLPGAAPKENKDFWYPFGYFFC